MCPLSQYQDSGNKKMLLTFLKNYAFSPDGISVTQAKVGEEHEVPDDIASAVVKANIAAPVKPAAKAKPEKSVKK